MIPEEEGQGPNDSATTGLPEEAGVQEQPAVDEHTSPAPVPAAPAAGGSPFGSKPVGQAKLTFAETLAQRQASSGNATVLPVTGGQQQTLPSAVTTTEQGKAAAAPTSSKRKKTPAQLGHFTKAIKDELAYLLLTATDGITAEQLCARKGVPGNGGKLQEYVQSRINSALGKTETEKKAAVIKQLTDSGVAARSYLPPPVVASASAATAPTTPAATPTTDNSLGWLMIAGAIVFAGLLIAAAIVWAPLLR